MVADLACLAIAGVFAAWLIDGYVKKQESRLIRRRLGLDGKVPGRSGARS